MRLRELFWRAAPCLLIALLAACGGGNEGTSNAVTTSQSYSTTGSSTPGVVVLSQTTYSVDQGGGAMTVVVDRTSGSAGPISVDYATANETASAGTDYTAASGSLTWADGDSATKSFKVNVSSSVAFTGSKTFKIALSDAGGGATLGTPDTATATIFGANTSSAGSIALSAATYSVAQSGGSVKITLDRSSGSAGAVTVNYATANGTASAGTNYTAESGSVSWANGDVSSKTFSVAVSNATPFSGSKTFTVTLSGPTGGAILAAPSSATVSITGSEAPTGSLALSSATYSAQQSAGSVAITVDRTGGSSGASSVNYATANGSATAGTDYTAASGTLNWAGGDSSAKTITVPVSNATPFTGTKSFTVNLTDAVNSALGNPASTTVAITGSGSQTGCAKNGNSYTTTGAFDYVVYGNYVVNNNNWGGTPGQKFWANSAGCWGVTTSATTDTGSPGSYPNVTRGWSSNGGVMQQLSDPGTNDWTTKSGMGISVTALTQATAHWAFTAPTSNARWMGLMDIYFHKTPNPDYTQFPPYTDLMVDQAIMDQSFSGTTFYAAVAAGDNASTVTLGGVKFLIYIDDSGETAYNSGGHTIHLFELPTAYTSNNGNPVWGSQDSRIDIKAIIDYLRQSNPLDDNGNPLKNANGQVVTSPLITDDLYLNAVNAGWEIIYGASFTNASFCLAMQNEPACP